MMMMMLRRRSAVGQNAGRATVPASVISSLFLPSFDKPLPTRLFRFYLPSIRGSGEVVVVVMVVVVVGTVDIDVDVDVVVVVLSSKKRGSRARQQQQQMQRYYYASKADNGRGLPIMQANCS